MATAKFSEWIEAGNDFTIPELVGIDESIQTETKQLIIDWFSARHVLNYNFAAFLQRTIDRDYPYYIELLRIDPTRSDFDWFVDNYQERQYKRQGADTDTQTGNTETKKSGKESTTRSGTAITHEGSTDTLTLAGSEIDTQSGSETEKTTGATGDKSVNRATAFARSAPMSQEYSKLNAVGAATLEATGGGKTIQISTPNDSYNRPGILNPTSSTDGMTENSGVTEEARESTRSFTDRQNTHSYNGRSDTRTVERNSTNSYNELKDTKEYGENGADLPTDMTTQNGETIHAHDTTDHEITTGRNQNPADLLTRAREYIEKSRAWLWFYNRLNACFMNCYEVEDYGY